MRVKTNYVAHTSINAGILEQSMGDRNQVGIGLSYRPARLHRLAESILWNRFLVALNVLNTVCVFLPKTALLTMGGGGVTATLTLPPTLPRFN
jgi:hypothetical protein